MRTGIVLAGGASTRMGAFKPLLPFRDRPLVAHVIGALTARTSEVLVMAGAHAADVSRVAGGARVLADPGEGPHVALRLAARAARHGALLVAPADSPFVAPALDALLSAGPNAAARDGDGVNPLVGLYERDALLEAFDPPVRSLQEIVARLRARAIAVPAGTLVDADTPEELSALDG